MAQETGHLIPLSRALLGRDESERQGPTTLATKLATKFRNSSDKHSIALVRLRVLTYDPQLEINRITHLRRDSHGSITMGITGSGRHR
jgi:hypothetical protein